mmetsp:Transcript_141273/g.256805  ORF Transcript_141273/g.256805 Transcript_141273/m.256805 type:complete len:344 (-) Transcript_141273:63-1094(-)
MERPEEARGTTATLKLRVRLFSGLIIGSLRDRNGSKATDSLQQDSSGQVTELLKKPTKRSSMSLSLRMRNLLPASEATSSSSRPSASALSTYNFRPFTLLQSSLSPSIRNSMNSMLSCCRLPVNLSANLPTTSLKSQGATSSSSSHRACNNLAYDSASLPCVVCVACPQTFNDDLNSPFKKKSMNCGMLEIHCSELFMKHVFPKFFSPAVRTFSRSAQGTLDVGVCPELLGETTLSSSAQLHVPSGRCSSSRNNWPAMIRETSRDWSASLSTFRMRAFEGSRPKARQSSDFRSSIVAALDTSHDTISEWSVTLQALTFSKRTSTCTSALSIRMACRTMTGPPP